MTTKITAANATKDTVRFVVWDKLLERACDIVGEEYPEPATANLLYARGLTPKQALDQLLEGMEFI